jgi:hypothetical protein
LTSDGGFSCGGIVPPKLQLCRGEPPLDSGVSTPSARWLCEAISISGDCACTNSFPLTAGCNDPGKSEIRWPSQHRRQASSSFEQYVCVTMFIIAALESLSMTLAWSVSDFEARESVNSALRLDISSKVWQSHRSQQTLPHRTQPLRASNAQNQDALTPHKSTRHVLTCAHLHSPATVVSGH